MKNKVLDKMREIGEIPVPLKTTVLLVVVTALVVRPPRVWMITNSQHLHRV